MSRALGEAEKVRRYGEFPYAAKTWQALRRVIARIEASPQGSDSRFIVTNLKGAPRWLYESVYCARGQAENLIKAPFVARPQHLSEQLLLGCCIPRSSMRLQQVRDHDAAQGGAGAGNRSEEGRQSAIHRPSSRNDRGA